MEKKTLDEKQKDWQLLITLALLHTIPTLTTPILLSQLQEIVLLMFGRLIQMCLVVNCGCHEKHKKKNQHGNLNKGHGINQREMKMFLSTLCHVTHTHGRKCPSSGRLDYKTN